MSYLKAINIKVDDIGLLIVSEIVKSPSLGEVVRESFIEGWQAHSYVDSFSITGATQPNPNFSPLPPSKATLVSRASLLIYKTVETKTSER